MESVSIFPPPPGYAELYATANDDADIHPHKPPSPPEPIEGEYVVFGELQETRTGIPKLTVEQLFDEENLDYKSALHKLHEDLLDTYAELIQTVVDDPERYARLTERIGVLIRNMLQLVNLMRPYQAVVSLKTAMEQDVAKRKQAIKDVRACTEGGRELLSKGIDREDVAETEATTKQD